MSNEEQNILNKGSEFGVLAEGVKFPRKEGKGSGWWTIKSITIFFGLGDPDVNVVIQDGEEQHSVKAQSLIDYITKK